MRTKEGQGEWESGRVGEEAMERWREGAMERWSDQAAKLKGWLEIERNGGG